jgi:hypothetical protein
MISLGYNCFPALAIRKINSFQPSLPFDYIGNYNGENSFIIVYEIIKELYNDQLDINKFVSLNNNSYNYLNFSMNHFTKKRHLKFFAKEEDKNILSLFITRFHRLKLNFFNQPNLLFYTSNRVIRENEEKLEIAAKNIIELNKLNHIIIIGPHKTKIINDNIEFVQHKRKSSRAITNCLKNYISKISPETKQYYEKYTPDTPT